MKTAIGVGVARSSCSKRLVLCRPSRREDVGHGRSGSETFLGLRFHTVPRILRNPRVSRPRSAVVNQLQKCVSYSGHVRGVVVIPSGSVSGGVDVPTSLRSSTMAFVAGDWSSRASLDPPTGKVKSIELSVVTRILPAVKSTRIESMGTSIGSGTRSVGLKFRIKIPPSAPLSSSCSPLSCSGVSGPLATAVAVVARIASATSSRG